MKILFIQFSETVLRLTCAKTGRRPVFYEPSAYAFPTELAGKVLEDPAAFARFAAECAKTSGHKAREAVLCMDDTHIISREYRHAPAKKKYYPSFARLEAEDLVKDDIKNYTIQSVEYGREVGGDGELSASLFAMNTKLATALRKAFAKAGLRLNQITPTITGALASASRMLTEKSGTVAILNLDYSSTRILVYTGGKTVFQRTFAGVADDIAGLVAAVNEVSLAEGLSLLRQHGMRTTDATPAGAMAKEQVDILLNAATGEVLRTLRMVLSSERLELDRIILCGPIASMPGFGAYCEEMGLEIPVEMMESSPTAAQVLPAVDAGAAGRGCKPGLYFSLSGLLSARKEGGVNFLSSGAQRGGSRAASIAAMAALTLLTAAAFSLQPLYYQSLLVRQAADKAALADPKYDETKALISEQARVSQQLRALEQDQKLLPYGQSVTGKILGEVQRQIGAYVASLDSCSINSREGTVALSFTTASFADYITLKNRVAEENYFVVSIPFSASLDQQSGQCVCSVTLTVREFTPFAAGVVPEEEGGGEE